MDMTSAEVLFIEAGRHSMASVARTPRFDEVVILEWFHGITHSTNLPSGLTEEDFLLFGGKRFFYIINKELWDFCEFVSVNCQQEKAHGA